MNKIAFFFSSSKYKAPHSFKWHDEDDDKEKYLKLPGRFFFSLAFFHIFYRSNSYRIIGHKNIVVFDSLIENKTENNNTTKRENRQRRQISERN